MAKFPEPKEGSVFYEDKKTYACLAFHPIVEGHTILAWKEDVEDINDLSEEDYLYLASIVYKVRRCLLGVYGTDKVYVAYLDEFRHVHFHLFPRNPGGEIGFGLMVKPHGELTDLSKIPALIRAVQ